MSESFVGLVAQDLFSVKHQFSGKTCWDELPFGIISFCIVRDTLEVDICISYNFSWLGWCLCVRIQRERRLVLLCFISFLLLFLSPISSLTWGDDTGEIYYKDKMSNCCN